MGTPNKDEAIAGLATRADFLSEKCRLLQTEVSELKSRVQGLKVNRDALFEENKRFRSVVVTDIEIIKELNNTIKELKSEFEGRMDGANEVIYQLELKIRLAKEAKKGLRLELIQMGGDSYFWFLMLDKEVLARSSKINRKVIIEKEVDAVAEQLGLPVIVNERR